MAGSASLLPFLRRSLFGKPDGTFIRLRCRLLGHRWRECHDWCCKGKEWCDWCLAPRTEVESGVWQS